MQHREPIRTYKARRRVTPGQAEALERLRPRWGAGLDDLGTPAALFGRSAPLVLEIGSGMGEATALLAAAEPHLDVLAVEVHTPGVATLLRRIEHVGLTNVRVAELDARQVLAALPCRSLQEVRVFFPDPWPKSRHHKRRLVSEPFLVQVAERLAPGGRLHVATDWADYAGQVQQLLTACLHFTDPVHDRAGRPVTRFERRGLAAGRPAVDLVSRLVVSRSPASCAAPPARPRSPSGPTSA